MTKESVLDEYGPDYYALRFGAVPYERSAHWVNFFSIASDQLIRALQPRRVLDAGCAMGFLVEAFWDRGVFCEGIDISEFAISQVRRDIRPFCSVGSLDAPIPGKYDLITCIEVLEHLPPEIVRPAVANICAATETLFFSSTPRDLDEPTHYSVHPPIYWLDLFREFDFWPDARFDASFLAPHAMLLRKGSRPPEDYLRLFSEYTRFKTAFEVRAAEAQTLDAELKNLRSQHAQLASTVQDLASTVENKEAELSTVRASLDSANCKFTELHEDRGRIEQFLTNSRLERDRLHARIQSLESQHWERDRITADLAAAQADKFRLEQEKTRLEQEKARLDHTVHLLNLENARANTVVHQVVTSRAWRFAETCRWPLRKIRSVFRPAARREVATSHSPAVEAASETSGPTDPPGPASFKASDDAAYQRWIDENEPSSDQLQFQRDAVNSLDGPIFSLIVPVHQTDHSMLQACVKSVLDQSYTRWQFCAAITPNEDTRNHEYLFDLQKRDVRFHIAALDINGGISSNSNAAIKLASGEFVALLDHDDTLAPFALFAVASCLQANRDTDILYSDHDYLNAETGLRHNPLFKPDWSPEIMFSANYITHLTILRRTLIDEIGGFDLTKDGAQDWDLFLRASEVTKRISHIPKILYHWRMHAGSTAQNDSAKSYVAEAQLDAIRGHMKRLKMDAEPEVMPDGLLHVRFNNPPTGLVSIVIPTKDRVDLLERSVSTLLEHTSYTNFEILIVDNGSKEQATIDYFSTLSDEKRVRVLWHPGSFNYSAANNRAARQSAGEFLLFLNNDIEITHPEWLTELVCWADQPDIGMVGAKLLRANGTVQHAGVVLGLSGFADHPFANGPALSFGLAGSTGWYRDFLAVTGACMLMQRNVFDDIGGFDESFVLCGSDVEICLRAHERGYRVIYNPFAELIHHERQTRGTEIPPGDYVESFKRYRPWLASGDPYWNPNLSLWALEPGFRSSDEASSYDFAQTIAQSAENALALANPPRPTTEEELMVGWFDCTSQQFEQLKQHNESIPGPKAIRRLLWFLPAFEVPFYGGIYTILRFCEFWTREHNIEIFFGICGHAEHHRIASLISQVYAKVQLDHVFILKGIASASDLPDVDASICTLWTTPFYALHHKAVGRRFYLIQDFEPAFYRAGSISALAESTYRMGLYGIANTVSLKRMYEAEYGGKSIWFTPRINSSVFYPAPDDSLPQSRKPLQVFFYGRPKHARNAFELVKVAMLRLKAKLGSQVRIVSAGDEWWPSEYGLQGAVENLGILAYEETARLYRESQVGVVMMLTRHPSYIPLELMASGCLAVTNISSWTSWLLQDGENCLLSQATSSAIAETVERGLLDFELRLSIRAKALEMIRSEYLDWPTQTRNVFEYLCDPESVLANADSN